MAIPVEFGETSALHNALAYNWTLNVNFCNNWKCIIVGIGKLWQLAINNDIGFNFERYELTEIPSMQLTNIDNVFNVEWIVQQLYIAHDHIVPTAKQQSGLHAAIAQWPDPENNNWSKMHNTLGNVHTCGVLWCCKQHQQINCQTCIVHNLSHQGTLEYSCSQQSWPFFKAYSIYQGYVNRLFNYKAINDTGW